MNLYKYGIIDCFQLYQQYFILELNKKKKILRMKYCYDPRIN